MPSWPTRLLHGSPPTISHFTNPVIPDQQSINHNDSHRDIQRHKKDLPNAPAATLATSPTNIIPLRPQHSRSISHPFLSNLAGHGGARRGEDTVKSGVKNLDGISFGALPAMPDSLQEASPYRGPPQLREADLVAGKCATCDSLVRWPKRLDVFRCTVCLMVNDLKNTLVWSSKDEGRVHESEVMAERPPVSKNFKPVPSISLARTKSIIDDCISLYLKERLQSTNGEGTEGARCVSEVNSVGANASLRSQNVELNAFPVQEVTVAQTQRIKPTASNQCRTAITVPATLIKSLPIGPRRSDHHDGHTNSALYSQPSLSRAQQSTPTTILPSVSEDLPGNIELVEKIVLESSISIFQPLESYIVACFSNCKCLNASFLVPKPPLARATSEGTVISSCSASNLGVWGDEGTPLSELDGKTLLLGDFAENGTWWTGRGQIDVETICKAHKKPPEKFSSGRVNLKTPRIHWSELKDWYGAVLSAGRSWRSVLHEAQNSDLLSGFDQLQGISAQDQQKIERDLSDACNHVRRTLLEASENLLRRPGIPIKCPDDCRFLLLLLANPVLNPSEYDHSTSALLTKKRRSLSLGQQTPSKTEPSAMRQILTTARGSPDSVLRHGRASKHSSIIKRILGIMSNLPDDCHHHLIAWFSRFSESHFRRTVDLIGSFLTHRLIRQHGRKHSNSHDPVDDLIPRVSQSGASSAQVHAALGITAMSKNPSRKEAMITYSEDWQIKAAARVMSLLCTANNSGRYRRPESSQAMSLEAKPGTAESTARQVIHRRGQIIPTSTFYNSLLDYSDLISDFDTWETRNGKFSFCQYPMFLSIWAKIHILGYDARRQMEIKAREAFFNSIMSRKAISQYLVLKVRRDCLVEDSLRGVSEVIGTGQEDIKKGLRIEFSNEEGIDRGGLRKEWFLLLVREVFDPEHGLFIYDEDSHYCYFNPNTFETSDQFFLIGVVLGLAIYNSTILDVALPPFAFRKLLASAPSYSGPASSSLRPAMGYSLEDLAEFRPSLAKGLGQLLDYDGDVEETFCRDFVAEVERYGQISRVPLCANGENRPVTNKNRREFVDLYIHYLLDAAVARQYEPFKRGFFTVCGGNALSLFRPEEIELLVRGSDEPLDVATLRAVAIYDGWGKGTRPLEEPVIEWFWATFAGAATKDQRKLLSFITSSDRIPAVGAMSLVIKIACLGDDCDRYPIARTCFNMLGIYRYRSKQILETRLWRAVAESEGFGFK